MAYYRKIYISGADRIPAHKPVLLACNHPNSFMDAIVMAIMLERPFHFLTRSDMFNTPLKQWVLAKINMIPIYRLKEGAENLHKNKDTFERCYQILQQGGMVLIFSEGACVHEKRLRTLKKGTARLAFGAEEGSNGQLDLQVLPVGINYTYPTLFRKEMMIGIAPPIELKDLLPEYSENPAKAINTFNERLTNGLRLNVIEQTKGTESLTEQLFILNRSNDPSFDSRYWLSPSHHRLYNEKMIAEQVNELYSKQPRSFADLAEQSASYFKQLESYSLHDRDLANPVKKLSKSLLLIIAGMPVFILGYLLNYIPAWIASKIADTKVRRVEFFSSVRMTVGFFLYLLYYVVLVVGVSFISARTGAILFFILPASGYLALLYRDLFLRVASARRFMKMLRHNKALAEGLIQTRNKLSKACEELHIHKSVTIV
jgi:glycerol-3-phosphate O-acyltransferase / dihydroxyacetone phosphate acyltransferase